MRARLPHLRQVFRAAALLPLVLCACRTSSSATLTLPSGEILRGSATAAVNGQYAVSNGRVNCTGTFEGRNVGGVALTFKRKASVTASCSNGSTASSPDQLWDAKTAELTFSDGKKGRITLGE